LDSTQAFLDAWTAACGSTNSNNDLHIYLKEGINLLGSVSFEGHNYTSPDITLRIDGTRLLMRIIAYLVKPMIGLALNVLVVSQLLAALLMLKDHHCGVAKPNATIVLLELRYSLHCCSI
jgi:hypothetical protein